MRTIPPASGTYVGRTALHTAFRNLFREDFVRLLVSFAAFCRQILQKRPTELLNIESKLIEAVGQLSIQCD